MNQTEWKKSGKFPGKYKWYNQTKKLQRSLQFNEDINATVIHHLRDTEEQRKYNDEHYEFWGFNEDGTFEYGKYVVFWTHEHHVKYHAHSDETRSKISESSRRNWQNAEYRNKVTSANVGKKMSDNAKQILRELHLGEKNPMYGKHPSEETNRKRSASLMQFWSSNDGLKRQYSEAFSGENNAMYGKFGENHPKYGTKLSDETKSKISENNGIRKMHVLYLQYKSAGGCIGWHDFQKLPSDKRAELSSKYTDKD